jgi:gas vesicle protein
MSNKGLFFGTLAAAAAGFAAGILLAPAKGSETRQKLADSTEELRKRLRNIRKQTLEELAELEVVFENEVHGLKEDVREKVLRLIEESKKSYNHVKDEAMSRS